MLVPIMCIQFKSDLLIYIKPLACIYSNEKILYVYTAYWNNKIVFGY